MTCHSILNSRLIERVIEIRFQENAEIDSSSHINILECYKNKTTTKAVS